MPAQQPWDVSFLMGFLPCESVFFAQGWNQNGVVDAYVGWMVIVWSNIPLNEQQWTDFRKTVGTKLDMTWSGPGNELEVVPERDEGAALERWKVKANGCENDKQTGTLQELSQISGSVSGGIANHSESGGVALSGVISHDTIGTDVTIVRGTPLMPERSTAPLFIGTNGTTRAPILIPGLVAGMPFSGSSATKVFRPLDVD